MHYSKGSHAQITCECEFKLSPQCIGSRSGAFKDFQDIKDRNGGKYICLHCSRKLKSSGRDNPNAKYSVDDKMFKNVDSDAKAYLLGWIASDGGLHHNGSITISIHKKDITILYALKSELNLDVPIFKCKGVKDQMVGIRLNSTELMQDVAALLGIPLDTRSLKKNRIVQMPTLASSELQWAFIRGYFDGDGSVCEPTNTRRSPQVSIASRSECLKSAIQSFCNIPCKMYDDTMWWFGNNALEFLDKLYGHNPRLRLERKADLYAQWATWIPSLLKGQNIRGYIGDFQWVKTRHDAVPPFKDRITDSGYDLTLIDVLKTVSDVTFYRTGIKATLPFGYYCDLVSRSSISKTGYILANGVGIIDRTYVGEIIVPLRKIDKSAPDLELPCRMVQLIPRHIVHFDLVEVDDLEQSARGAGGFGSTGAG